MWGLSLQHFVGLSCIAVLILWFGIPALYRKALRMYFAAKAAHIKEVVSIAKGSEDES